MLGIELQSSGRTASALGELNPGPLEEQSALFKLLSHLSGPSESFLNSSFANEIYNAAMVREEALCTPERINAITAEEGELSQEREKG